MKRLVCLLALVVLCTTASAAVRIMVEDQGDGKATIMYRTDGEKVRAFALDITVDTGVITGISGFHVGESTAAKPGYGIFPASFARFISVDPATGEVGNWDVNNYTPLADPCDPGSLGGLGTAGATIEMGALYSPPDDSSPNAPGNVPTFNYVLCKLAISQTANVTAKLNTIRGGVVLTDPAKKATVDLTKATAIVAKK